MKKENTIKIIRAAILLLAIGLAISGLVGYKNIEVCENALKDTVKQYCVLKGCENTIPTYEIRPEGTIIRCGCD